MRQGPIQKKRRVKGVSDWCYVPWFCWVLAVKVADVAGGCRRWRTSSSTDSIHCPSLVCFSFPFLFLRWDATTHPSVRHVDVGSGRWITSKHPQLNLATADDQPPSIHSPLTRTHILAHSHTRMSHFPFPISPKTVPHDPTTPSP
jgi:hypothetical protein